MLVGGCLDRAGWTSKWGGYVDRGSFAVAWSRSSCGGRLVCDCESVRDSGFPVDWMNLTQDFGFLVTWMAVNPVEAVLHPYWLWVLAQIVGLPCSHVWPVDLVGPSLPSLVCGSFAEPRSFVLREWVITWLKLHSLLFLPWLSATQYLLGFCWGWLMNGDRDGWHFGQSLWAA